MPDSIHVRFACGHALSLGSEADVVSVECATCGERLVQSVSAPPPQFRFVNCNQSRDVGPLGRHAE